MYDASGIGGGFEDTASGSDVVSSQELAREADEALGGSPATQCNRKRKVYGDEDGDGFKKVVGGLTMPGELKPPGYCVVDYPMNATDRDREYNNFHLFYALNEEDTRAMKGANMGLARYHYVGQNRFGYEYRKTIGCFSGQINSKNQVDCITEYLGVKYPRSPKIVLGFTDIPDALQYWEVSLHRSIGITISSEKTGDVTGDFLSVVLEKGTSLWKLLATMQEKFGAPIYRSTCYLPTVTNKPAYSWKMSSTVTADALKKFMKFHKIPITSMESN